MTDESLRVSAGQRLLFIGDSNTDTEYRGRFPPHGYGYVMFVAAMIATSRPELQLDIINRGNDGDTVVDLGRRWQTDVIDLQPDWLFVLIGTNDVAYRYAPDPDNRKVDDETYRQTLSRLVADARKNTSARIVLVEPMPYELPPDVDDEPNKATERLCDLLAPIAQEYDCGLVHVRAAMADIMAAGQANGWYQNFNHPAFPGHAFIAQQILRHLGWTL